MLSGGEEIKDPETYLPQNPESGKRKGDRPEDTIIIWKRRGSK
jgi:hypothetical protein